ETGDPCGDSHELEHSRVFPYPRTALHAFFACGAVAHVEAAFRAAWASLRSIRPLRHQPRAEKRRGSLSHERRVQRSRRGRSVTTAELVTASSPHTVPRSNPNRRASVHMTPCARAVRIASSSLPVRRVRGRLVGSVATPISGSSGSPVE